MYYFLILFGLNFSSTSASEIKTLSSLTSYLSLSPFSLSPLSPTHLQGAPHIKTHVHDIGW